VARRERDGRTEVEEEAEVEEVVEAVLVGGPGHLRFDECALGALQTRHVESCDPARKLCGRSYEGGRGFLRIWSQSWGARGRGFLGCAWGAGAAEARI
jgi:hypothetical protein